MIIVDDAVIVCIQAGQDRCSAGRAKRGCHISIGKDRSVGRDRINVRCFQERMAGGAQAVKAVIVTKDKDNVGRRINGCFVADQRRDVQEPGKSGKIACSETAGK